MLWDFFFLLLLFLIGGICSFTDIKYNKIKNSVLLIGFVFGILLHIGVALYLNFNLKYPLNLGYFKELITNTLIALLVGYSLWYFGFWSAGDAKLFVLYAFLIPLDFYSEAYLPYFPSFVILINIFVPFFIFFLVKGTILGLKEVLKELRCLDIKKVTQKSILNKITSIIVRYFQIIFILLVFYFLKKIVEIFSKYFFKWLLNNSVFVLLLLFAINFVLKNKLMYLFKVVLGIGIVLYLVFQGQMNFILNILKHALYLMFFLLILQFIFRFYFENKETEKIKIKDLKEGSILTENSLRKLTEKNLKLSKQILGQEEVSYIKRAFNRSSEMEIEVYKTFPFAIFLLIGSVLTILSRGALAVFILNILKNIIKL